MPKGKEEKNMTFDEIKMEAMQRVSALNTKDSYEYLVAECCDIIEDIQFNCMSFNEFNNRDTSVLPLDSLANELVSRKASEIFNNMSDEEQTDVHEIEDSIFDKYEGSNAKIFEAFITKEQLIEAVKTEIKDVLEYFEDNE